MFNNPISYAGYPPGANGKANNTNSTVRAATSAEALAGTKTNVYVTPAELTGARTAPSVSGTSPIVNNARVGQISSSTTVANGAYTTYTMTNSLITASSVIQATASCTTVSSAVSVVGVVPGSGTVAFRVFNGGSATTAANVIITYEIYN